MNPALGRRVSEFFTGGRAMMAGHELDALSTSADRIHRQLQQRRLRLMAATGATRGAQRLQQTALELRERLPDPSDPVRWLRLKSTGSAGLSGRMTDED
jgi:hypothetical protein